MTSTARNFDQYATTAGDSGYVVRAEPVQVRNFRTDGSSSYMAGDQWVLMGLLNGARQTCSAHVWHDDDIVRREIPELFALGVPKDAAVNAYAARENLMELRRLTGFTWDELAQFIGVDRRSLHNWAQGGAVRIDNRKKLADALRLMYFVDRGTCAANRIALHDTDRLGTSAMHLASQGRFHEARIAAGRGKGQVPTTFSALDSARTSQLGPLGIGYFSDSVSAENEINASSEPPIRKAPSRRISLKRD